MPAKNILEIKQNRNYFKTWIVPNLEMNSEQPVFARAGAERPAVGTYMGGCLVWETLKRSYAVLDCKSDDPCGGGGSGTLWPFKRFYLGRNQFNLKFKADVPASTATSGQRLPHFILGADFFRKYPYIKVEPFFENGDFCGWVPDRMLHALTPSLNVDDDGQTIISLNADNSGGYGIFFAPGEGTLFNTIGRVAPAKVGDGVIQPSKERGILVALHQALRIALKADKAERGGGYRGRRKLLIRSPRKDIPSYVQLENLQVLEANEWKSKKGIDVPDCDLLKDYLLFYRKKAEPLVQSGLLEVSVIGRPVPDAGMRAALDLASVTEHLVEFSLSEKKLGRRAGNRDLLWGRPMPHTPNILTDANEIIARLRKDRHYIIIQEGRRYMIRQKLYLYALKAICQHDALGFHIRPLPPWKGERILPYPWHSGVDRLGDPSYLPFDLPIPPGDLKQSQGQVPVNQVFHVRHHKYFSIDNPGLPGFGKYPTFRDFMEDKNGRMTAENFSEWIDKELKVSGSDILAYSPTRVRERVLELSKQEWNLDTSAVILTTTEGTGLLVISDGSAEGGVQESVGEAGAGSANGSDLQEREVGGSAKEAEPKPRVDEEKSGILQQGELGELVQKAEIALKTDDGIQNDPQEDDGVGAPGQGMEIQSKEHEGNDSGLKKGELGGAIERADPAEARPEVDENKGSYTQKGEIEDCPQKVGVGPKVDGGGDLGQMAGLKLVVLEFEASSLQRWEIGDSAKKVDEKPTVGEGAGSGRRQGGAPALEEGVQEPAVLVDYPHAEDQNAGDDENTELEKTEERAQRLEEVGMEARAPICGQQ